MNGDESFMCWHDDWVNMFAHVKIGSRSVFQEMMTHVDQEDILEL